MYESGALNPNSVIGMTKAKELYEQIKRRRTDYINVADNTNFSIEQCKVIKDYIFINMHELHNGYMSFFPDLSIAQSWLRLSERNGKNILAHDIILLQHELTEILFLLGNTNMHQAQAHILAEQKYNYSLAVKNYYATLGIYI